MIIVPQFFLGQPFLVTMEVDIDVRSRKISLNFETEKNEFVATKYDRKPPDNSYCRVKVINPYKEDKSNKNINEKSPRVIGRHNDSDNINRARDRTFMVTYRNPKKIL
jgi:hypothetical protein